MKVKLVESTGVFTKFQRDFENNILGSLTDMGFDFDLHRTKVNNKFSYTYFGRYTNYKGETLPCSLNANTAHRGMDETTDDIFLTLTLGSTVKELGPCNVNDIEYVTDLVDTAFPEIENQKYMANQSTDAEDNLISNGNGEQHTLVEWINLAIEKSRAAYKGGPSFGSWLNNDVTGMPRELSSIVSNKIMDVTTNNPTMLYIAAEAKALRELKEEITNGKYDGEFTS